MKNYNRYLALFLALVMIFALAAPFKTDVFAEADDVTSLQELNLLDKEGNTAEKLDSKLTRAEGLTMVLRALGYSKEDVNKEEVLKLNKFTDVPEWFKGFAGLGVDLKITAGKTDELFAPEQTMTKREFLAFVLRALKHNPAKAWENADKLAKENALVKEDVKVDEPITKREASSVIVNALNAKMQAAVDSQTLGEFLVYRGAISKEKAAEYGVKMLDPKQDVVDILYFNDFHGNIKEEVTGKKRNIGMTKMVGYVNEYIAENPNTIVLSGGDNYQGTAESNLTYGKPVSAMMKGMNVLASAVGNHEFDWGYERIANWAKEGNFKYLAANIYDEKTNKPVDWVEPYMIVEKGGVKMAFIGLAHPDTPSLTGRAYTKGLQFRDPVKSAEEWVKFLQDGKAKEGKPDVIIALTHLDSDQNKKSKEITGNVVALAQVKGLDGILSAHSHRSVSGKVNGVEVMQAYCYGRSVGIMSIAKKDGKYEVTSKLYQGTDIKDVILKDSETVKLYDAAFKEIEPITSEVLGEAVEELTHNRSVKGNISVLGKWVCEVSAEATGAQIAIQNGGGVRRTLNKGNITMGDMYEIMPFDNYFVVMDLSGAELKKAINHGIYNPKYTDGSFSGLLVEFDSTREFGDMITKITLEDGTPLDMDKKYRVVINDFIFTTGDDYDFSKAENVFETYLPIRDALVEYVKKNKKITPKPIDGIIKDISKKGAALEQFAA